ncbi:unnamed protein product [Heligmosomoides polygyrus]|uniref:Uncharacterized protein n=1 Tax=Heligmosomoides polygyrus TaxID=6339 RepID=A0A3P8CIR1_HELPZ|nr:unnamed protein product [Heligmosomoides polygyrus]
MTFGSWTYNRDEIKLDFLHADRVDFSEYSTSSIWDMMDAPAVLTEDRSRIEFQVRIRRKTLFYTVVLILPTVLMAFLNVTVFYLPTASGEKMGLTMNVLLSIVVFLLLVSKILPPTSSSIPLVAKYLLLTFVLNIITILITVVICNIYFRSPITHRLPPWVRSVFLDVVVSVATTPDVHAASTPEERPSPEEEEDFREQREPPSCPTESPSTLQSRRKCTFILSSDGTPLIRISHPSYDELAPDAQRAVDAIEFITENMKDDETTKQYRDDWKFVAMVVDRVLLYGFFGITLGGTIGKTDAMAVGASILFSAPTVFERVDEHKHLKTLIHLYKQGLPANDTFIMPAY